MEKKVDIKTWFESEVRSISKMCKNYILFLKLLIEEKLVNIQTKV